MTLGIDWYAKLRTVGPDLPMTDALALYLQANPDQAIRIARSNGPDPFFDKRDLKAKLNEMNGYDAFMLACRSDFDLDGDVFWFNEWGELESADYDNLGRICATYVLRNLADDILDGKVDIPEELEEILTLWEPGNIELCKKYLPAKSRNAKRRRH